MQEYLDWMIDEPQTLVWLPTLHRLAMSETGIRDDDKGCFPLSRFSYTHVHARKTLNPYIFLKNYK